MTSRIDVLKAEIAERENEIVRIIAEEEASRVRQEAVEAFARAKTVRISEEPYKKNVPLSDALNIAIDIGEDCIFADNCVKRSEAKLAEYEGFATMGAYQAREILEENLADAAAAQRKWYTSVHDVLIAMRDTERERTRYLEKLGLDLETLKKVIGC
jgi:hypothetical protein